MPLNSTSSPGKSWSVGVVSAQPLSGPTTLELVGTAPVAAAIGTEDDLRVRMIAKRWKAGYQGLRLRRPTIALT
jgi:hypothetical protein